MEQVNRDITVPQATDFIHRNISQQMIEICPAMLPFVQPLVVAKNSDKKDALFLTDPNTNHNTLSTKMVAEMINNLLNDPLKLSKNGSSEMGQDMKFLMIDMSPPGNDDDVSPIVLSCHGNTAFDRHSISDL